MFEIIEDHLDECFGFSGALLPILKRLFGIPVFIIVMILAIVLFVVALGVSMLLALPVYVLTGKSTLEWID